MRPIAANGVAWSVCRFVCLLVTTMSIEKQLNRLECGVLGPKVGPDPYRKGQFSGHWKASRGLCCTVCSYRDHSFFINAQLQKPTAMLPPDWCSIAFFPVKNPLYLRCGLFPNDFGQSCSTSHGGADRTESWRAGGGAGTGTVRQG